VMFLEVIDHHLQDWTACVPCDQLLYESISRRFG
jgi:hypothetical protein